METAPIQMAAVGVILPYEVSDTISPSAFQLQYKIGNECGDADQ